MTPSEQSYTEQDFDLTELHVVENAADGSLLLGVDRHDPYRLQVTIGGDEDQDQITRVYPCQACGWRLRCAEGCHS